MTFRERAGRLTAYALFACALTATRTASAQAGSQPGTDTVYLKSGGVVRGSVMEYEPSGQARVQLANGEVRTIPSDQIARVAMGAQNASSTQPSAASLPPAETARLQVAAPRDVEVVGRPNDGFEWAPICSGTCDRAVRLDWEYQVRGEGIKPSAPFQVSASNGQSALVKVDPASKGWFIVGIIGMIGGANVTVVGLYVMLIGALVQDVTYSSGTHVTTQSTSGAILAVGGVITAVGVAALVGGAIATFGNWSTKVKQANRADARPLLPAPVWRTAEVRDVLPLPTPIGAPILTVRF